MKILHKQNFTLIEMLIVIVIIAILFAMIFPATNYVRERAKQTECLGRIRNVSQMGTIYSAHNNGQAPISGGYIPPGSKDPSNHDFSFRIMEGLMHEVRYRRDASWWMFICTNVLPYWNAGATMNANGYTKGAKNAILEPEWERLNHTYSGPEPDICFVKGGPQGTQGAVYSFGNFACNTNGDIPTRLVNNQPVILLHMSQIKSPGKRAFIVEEGESTNKDNGTHLVEYVKYSDPISRGKSNKGTATGYIPGLGAGGVGKEKMEKIGFDSTISEDELDDERLELVKKDVMEGRHSGMTMHGFFDGHAEAIPAEVVGALQLGRGDDKDDLIGPYGKITEPVSNDDDRGSIYKSAH